MSRIDATQVMQGQESMGQVDGELFELVSTRLAEVNSEVERLARKVERLSSSMEHSELLFSLPEVELISRSKLNHVVISASDPVSLESNMYQLEESNGSQYRWLGPKRLTRFALPIDRSQERTLVLDLLSQVSVGLYGSLKIYVDGELVQHATEMSGESAKVFVNLPESNRVQDTMVVVFCPKMFKPSDLNCETTDTRQLSVSFLGLEAV